MELSKLKLNPKNPRVIKDDKFKQLCKSIQDFPEMMEKRPMVCVTDTVDGKLFPLGGNMRLKALKELKYTDIPDSWVSIADDWTEEKRAEFVIKDNVSFGEWNFEKMLSDWDNELLCDWGLDLPDFEEINQQDYSDKNKEINTDDFSDKIEMKLFFTSEEYSFVIDRFSYFGVVKEEVLLKLLKYEHSEI